MCSLEIGSPFKQSDCGVFASYMGVVYRLYLRLRRGFMLSINVGRRRDALIYSHRKTEYPRVEAEALSLGRAFYELATI